MTPYLEWLDWHHIADCAARVFKDELPREHPHSPIDRAYTRRPCVHALRAMWRTGDRELRSLVIARVTVWCWAKTDNYDCGARIKAIEARVLGQTPSTP
ncbi:MAG: hypothetical protein ABFD89_06865 [Bryobacteraceae bacterium]